MIRERSSAGVLTLILNRPEARNSFDRALYCALSRSLREAKDDDAVRVVLLTGAGKGFCAGQDLGDSASPPAPSDANQEFPFGDCLEQLISLDKPLLAAVHGAAIGIGATLLLHCDVVHVARGARLRLPFVQLGIVPEAASTYLLPLRIGWQHAAEIVFTGEWIESERAVELGLATREIAPEQLLRETQALADRIAAQPIGALRYAKRLLRASQLEGIRAAREREERAVRECIGRPENLAAVRAFLDRRSAERAKRPASDAVDRPPRLGTQER